MPINYTCKSCGKSFITLRAEWCHACLVAGMEVLTGKVGA